VFHLQFSLCPLEPVTFTLNAHNFILQLPVLSYYLILVRLVVISLILYLNGCLLDVLLKLHPFLLAVVH
jgi:hypothetical protein